MVASRVSKLDAECPRLTMCWGTREITNQDASRAKLIDLSRVGKRNCYDQAVLETAAKKAL